MTPAATAILYVLLALPICWRDRAELDRRDRLALIATAITEASESVDGRSKLVTGAYFESRLCRDVHAGTSAGPAAGLWQIEPGSRRPGPYAGLSAEATELAALNAWLLEHAHRCGHSDAAVFTAYAGAPCGSAWPTLAGRVRMVRWVRNRLTRVPSPKAIRDALDQVCERDGCTTDVHAGAVEDLYNEAPGSFGGLTAMQAAESLIQGQRSEYPP